MHTPSLKDQIVFELTIPKNVIVAFRGALSHLHTAIDIFVAIALLLNWWFCFVFELEGFALLDELNLEVLHLLHYRFVNVRSHW